MWKPVKPPLLPWVNTVNRILSSFDIPEMRGPTIYITSDYSGDHKKYRYQVTSVLAMDVERSHQWEFQRRAVRQRFLSDGRRMSFKRLGDRRRQRALIPFLDAADEIIGVCVTVAVRKSIRALFCGREHSEKVNMILGLQSRWKHGAFEKMLQATHLVSLIVGGLSRPNQNIYWISDEDMLFANARKSEELAKLFSGFTSVYVKHQLGELGVGTTKLDESDLFAEDLAAIPDLVAGTVAETTTKLSMAFGGRIPYGVVMPSPSGFTSKTDLLTSWLSDQTQNLKRVVILFEDENDGTIRVSRFGIEQDLLQSDVISYS